MQPAPSNNQAVLVVDFDGVLVRSDLGYEAFWGALASNWTVPFVALASLLRGRAALKQRLAELGKVDVRTLPYDHEALAYIRRWHMAGGWTVLIISSHRELADKIAAHLGIFDEVYASLGTTTPGPEAKAAFLKQRFGEGRFAYMGHSAADLPVWERSSKAITVDAPAPLTARVSAVNSDAEHLLRPTASFAPYIKALRPHQWSKNVLVFVPMLTAHQFALETFAWSLLAFIAFCLLASSAYVLNDLLDLSADRAHPRKRNRPLASGALPIAHGTLIAPLLFFGGLACALPIGKAFVLVMVAYYATTMAYSLDLKRRLIIDICILAGLYAFRLVAGGVATDIQLSVWLLAFSIFFFLSLAAIKRQAELVDGAASGNLTAHGRGYHVGDVTLIESMATAAGYVSVLVMALYVNSPAVLKLYAQPQALWGICLVLLYWISRMVMATHRGRMRDDPIVFAVKDNYSRICLLLVLMFVAGGALL